MKTIDAYQIKPLDGLASGTVRPFSKDDFDRLEGMGALREATEAEVKAAAQHLNKMAPAVANKDIGAQRDGNGDTPEMADLRKRFDLAFAEQGAKLTTATADIERLTGEVSALTTAAALHEQEVAGLNGLLAGKDAEIAALKAAASPAPLKAEHHGGGKFNITQGESVLAQGLSKADADAFNAMSDEDKAAFVAKPKA